MAARIMNRIHTSILLPLMRKDSFLRNESVVILLAGSIPSTFLYSQATHSIIHGDKQMSISNWGIVAWSFWGIANAAHLYAAQTIAKAINSYKAYKKYHPNIAARFSLAWLTSSTCTSAIVLAYLSLNLLPYDTYGNKLKAWCVCYTTLFSGAGVALYTFNYLVKKMNKASDCKT